MKFSRNVLQTLDDLGITSPSFQKATKPLLTCGTTPINNHFLHSKNIIISGEFLTKSDNIFKENLLKSNVNVELEITPETEILICGKYPDWMLVEEASLYGIKVIFIDKAGELFSRMAPQLYRSKPVLLYEEPLGV